MRWYSHRHLSCLWNMLCYVIQMVRLIISTDSINIPRKDRIPDYVSDLWPCTICPIWPLFKRLREKNDFVCLCMCERDMDRPLIIFVVKVCETHCYLKTAMKSVVMSQKWQLQHNTCIGVIKKNCLSTLSDFFQW